MPDKKPVDQRRILSLLPIALKNLSLTVRNLANVVRAHLPEDEREGFEAAFQGALNELKSKGTIVQEGDIVMTKEAYAAKKRKAERRNKKR